MESVFIIACTDQNEYGTHGVWHHCDKTGLSLYEEIRSNLRKSIDLFRLRYKYKGIDIFKQR